MTAIVSDAPTATRHGFDFTKLVLYGFALALCLLGVQPAFASDYLSRPDVRSFIDTVSEEYGIESTDLERILGEVRYSAAAVRLTAPVPTSAPSRAR